MKRLVLPLVMLSVLAACAEAPKAPAVAAASAPPKPLIGVPPKPVVVPATTPIVVREPSPADVAAYKVGVAHKIADSNSNAVKTNAPRPADSTISGLTVVGVQVRADGSTERVWVVRSSGKPTLDKIALDSLTRSLPLPAPTEAAMVGRGYTVFAESWIHRNDGKFQLVSMTNAR